MRIDSGKMDSALVDVTRVCALVLRLVVIGSLVMGCFVKSEIMRLEDEISESSETNEEISCC